MIYFLYEVSTSHQGDFHSGIVKMIRPMNRLVMELNKGSQPHKALLLALHFLFIIILLYFLTRTNAQALYKSLTSLFGIEQVQEKVKNSCVS